MAPWRLKPLESGSGADGRQGGDAQEAIDSVECFQEPPRRLAGRRDAAHVEGIPSAQEEAKVVEGIAVGIGVLRDGNARYVIEGLSVGLPRPRERLTAHLVLQSVERPGVPQRHEQQHQRAHSYAEQGEGQGKPPPDVLADLYARLPWVVEEAIDQRHRRHGILATVLRLAEVQPATIPLEVCVEDVAPLVALPLDDGPGIAGERLVAREDDLLTGQSLGARAGDAAALPLAM